MPVNHIIKIRRICLNLLRLTLDSSGMGRTLLLRILLPGLILCTSCTTFIFYPVQTPPDISTDGRHNKIVFINIYDYTNLPYENENKTEVYANGARQLIEKLEDSFRSDENFSFMIIDSLVRGRALTDFPEDLDGDYVASLCKSNDADMLLLLETFDARFSTETIVEESEEGGK